jgi:hypothetical protein
MDQEAVLETSVETVTEPPFWLSRLHSLRVQRHLLPACQRGMGIGIGTDRSALMLGIGAEVEPAELMAVSAPRCGLVVSHALAKVPGRFHQVGCRPAVLPGFAAGAFMAGRARA